MYTIVNTEQAAAWNGDEGAHWADHQADYDAVNGGFNEALFTAAPVADRDRVLDIGCGNGQVTRLAARRAAWGHAVGIDLSLPILRRARATAVVEDVTNVEFVQGDAQVHPFPDARFDVAVSRFGVMFFADPVAAFRNVHRALRPGGRLVFLCLQPMERNEIGSVLSSFTRRHTPAGTPVRPADLAGAFSLADRSEVTALLERAGFRDVAATGVEAPQTWGRDAVAAARFLAGWGPVRAIFPAEPYSSDGAHADLYEALTAYETPAGVRLTGAAWLVTATA
ncbi:class I SAM-dependent methyltransferase [Actinacidiphila paucisporea]|uniref:Methyltransferase domain-containing protein n=1 Tax=Actinacidiphila paucisporea TaxID=310782 RepID=A0A1M7G629_9ACTN|nr:class I SAM-dependent methyltransferase [Actinacidiphila paucisporea]SHM11743.1 Methyltransferase domain-containing protein [Actinacidiphila paucisporea]